MLHAGNQPYHLSCLRCCVCLFTLDKESSCFIRDGNVYCKYHYARYNYVIIWAYVKLKSAFEHAQNANIQIILRKISSMLLLTIHLFNYYTPDIRSMFVRSFVFPSQCQSFCVNITKTRLYSFDPLKPHIYTVKLGFTGVYINFLISAQKHRLWVLDRTASPRWF